MKTILTVSFLFLTQNLLLAQYVIGWDTIFSSSTIESELADIKLDYFGNTFSVEKVGNSGQTMSREIVKRNELGNIIWSNDTLIPIYQDCKILGFDINENLIVTTAIHGTNTKRIVKLNKNNGLPISEITQTYFGNTYSVSELKFLADGSIIVLGAGTSGPFIAKYDVNGVMIWHNVIPSATNCSFAKGEIIGDKIICFAYGGNSSYVMSHICALNINTGASLWNYSKPNNWHVFSDMTIRGNTILMVGTGLRTTSNHNYNLLYKIDTNGLNAKAIDSSRYFTSSPVYRRILTDNNSIFVLSTTNIQSATLFKFDQIGSKLDSIPLNVNYDFSYSNYFNGKNNFHRHHNLLFVVGYKIIGSYKERAIAIFDNNTSQVSEIIDLNPSVAPHGDEWHHSSVNFQGGLVVGGFEIPGGNINNAKIIYYTRPDLSIETLEKNSIKLFPNPSNNRVYLTMSQGVQNTAVKIYNISGQEVLNIPITTLLENETLEIDITSLARGFYMVQINNTTQKLVVE
jgi:hypothetical protein